MKQGDAVWITKYALTKGIIQSRVRDVSGRLPERIYADHPKGWGWRVGVDAWDNPADAREHAEKMRENAIRLAEKKAQRLRDLVITVVVQ